jgi:hypothetical protein
MNCSDGFIDICDCANSSNCIGCTKKLYFNETALKTLQTAPMPKDCED